MEKRSSHWADALKWMETVANSCETKEQAKSCERLVWNFHRAYRKRLGYTLCLDLTREIEEIYSKHLFPPYKSKKI